MGSRSLPKPNALWRSLLVLGVAALVVSAAVSGAALWIFSAEEGAASNDRVDDSLKGPVKQVVVEVAPLVDRFGEWVETARSLESETFYDSRGRVNEMRRYNPDNTLDYRFSYEYDNDLLLEETSYDASGAILYKWIYRYDEQGNQQSVTGYGSDGRLDFRTLYRNDDKGRLVREISYDRRERMTYQAEYRHDRNGKQRISHYYTPSGVVDYRVEETFDAAGNRTEEVSFGPDGEEQFRVVFRYTSDGELLEEIAYGSEGQIEYRLVNEYDEDGHLREAREYDGDGNVFYMYSYRHDAVGNLTERISSTADGSLAFKFQYRYEFDARGNWIVQRTSRYVTRFGEQIFEPVEVRYRHIEYY